MKKLLTNIIYALALCGLVACEDLNELRSETDDLESRVTALETQISAFNENVLTLQQLLSAGTINQVNPTEEGYELLMSNGKTLTVRNGHDGDGITPIMGIDKDGYWTIDYQDGKGAVSIMQNGRKVKAVGLDGIAPVFGVDAEGYWTISCNGNTEYLKDKDGNKVQATAASSIGNPFLEKVSYEAAEELFVLTLRDAGKTEVKIHVANNFLFSIKGTEKEQLFEDGQTITYPVEMKGVGKTLLFKPEGWKAELQEGKLAVTAPVSTRSLADTRNDIAVLAYCDKGDYVTIAKMTVKLKSSIVTHNPVASLYIQGDPTISEIRYQISLSDATSYKYIFRETTHGIPTLEEIAANGKTSAEAALIFGNLVRKTEYVLAVLPYHEDLPGKEVAILKAITAKPQYKTLYDAYNDGEEIIIAGKKVSKAIYGEAKVLESAQPVINQDGVIFVPSDVIAQHAPGSSKRGTLIIIGNDPSMNSRMEFTGTASRIEFKGENGDFMMKGIDLKANTTSGEAQIVFKPSDASPMKDIAFDHCRFDLNGFQGFSFVDGKSIADQVAINSISFENCDLNLGTKTRLSYIFQYRKWVKLGTLYFKNNIVWSDKGRQARLFNGVNGSDYANGSTVGTIDIEQNTWINNHPSSLCFVKTAGKFILKNNIFHAPITSYTPVLFNAKNEDPTEGEVKDNIGFVNSSSKVVWKAANPNTLPFPVFHQITNCKTDPFIGGTFDEQNGIFVPDTDFTSFGAQR